MLRVKKWDVKVNEEMTFGLPIENQDKIMEDIMDCDIRNWEHDQQPDGRIESPVRLRIDFLRYKI